MSAFHPKRTLASPNPLSYRPPAMPWTIRLFLIVGGQLTALAGLAPNSMVTANIVNIRGL